MTTTVLYDKQFYQAIEDGSRRSARAVLPHLLTLVSPQNIVDVGCGAGAWLAVAREIGIENVLGIDGDYVDAGQLRIPRERFLSADISHPFAVDRRFDLVLSLEVAEHIAPERAEVYIDNLVSLGEVIAFSAAIPNQTGHGHVNEQWPDYWAALFRQRGYRVLDCLREKIWDNREVERWYRQNLLLYVQEERLQATPALANALHGSRSGALSLVHPATYMAPPLSALLHMIPGTIRRAVRRRLRKT